jgi:protein SCO1/2
VKPGRAAWCAALIVTATLVVRAADRYAVTGMVLEVDVAGRTFVASIEAIPGYMAAMTMPFRVADPKQLTGIAPGAVVDRTSSSVTDLRVRRYENIEQDPLAARRLSLLREVVGGVKTRGLPVGATVPDFTLVDHRHRLVSLSQFRGQVVVINFTYTSCRLPDFCLRIVNHFGALAKPLRDELGRELVFLTMTFDPARDHPNVLDHYASQWKPVPDGWRFLTGSEADIERVLGYFGVGAFRNEGLMDHALRTILIDRRGAVAATIDGNRYSTGQLADLIRTVMRAGR